MGEPVPGATRANTAQAPPGSLRFRAAGIPSPLQIDLWKAFGEEVFRVELETLPAAQFHSDWSVRAVAGVGIAWAENSPMRINFPPALILKGNDNIAFQWATAPRFGAHLGHEIEAKQNEAVLVSCSDPGSMGFPTGGRMIVTNVPRAPLCGLLRAGEGCLAKPLPRDTGALKLLIGYLEVLRDEAVAVAPELQQLAALHIYDLLAMAIGPTGDAAEQAKGRGVRAAHLHAIKQDIAAHLDGELSLDGIAARHRITPRYARMLFEDTGTTFTEFVREERLKRAYRMLINRRFDHERIGDIAYDCGFNDLSYFNRLFRRRFGLSPGEVRERALSERQERR